jgi:arylsulfatase
MRPGRLFACFVAVNAVHCGGAPATSPVSPSSASSSTAVAPVPPSAPSGPPNIVLVLADDLGYGDLSSYGNRLVETTQIDRLAAEGMRFTDFYTPSPVCAPARAALMTGRWGIRNGIKWNTGTPRLFPGEVMIASVLKARGYATGVVGKWHLGATQREMPPWFGFDFFYGVKSSPPQTDFVSGDRVTNDFPGMDLVTERFTQEAVKFLRASADKPVFLYLAHHVAHSPHWASATYAGRTSRSYYDAVLEMDDSLSRAMNVLREQGKERNTLVLFTSDNGPENVVGGTAGALIGTKATIHEGGIRVPFIAWWPGRIPAGRVTSEPATTLDLFPTIVNFAGATMPARQYDGASIAALLAGETPRIGGAGIDGGRELLFWEGTSQAAAIRSGRWKYIRGPTSAASSGSLFDLVDDPGEQRNLIRGRPDLGTLLLRRMNELGR